MVLGDDMVIMESIMNCALYTLHEWTIKNQMEVNTEKTNYQIFSMCNISTKPNLFINNSTVDEILNQCYLGIILDQRLTFKFHVKELGVKAENRLKLLKRLTGTMWGTSKDTLILTYKSYIHPVLTYGEELLISASKSVNNELEIIQNKALRTISGGVKFTPITAMEMFTGIKPLKFSREEAALKTFEKIIRTPNSLWNNFEANENRLKSKPNQNHL